ncbi:TPA: hypothetical protein MFN52_004699 [Klebsiella quasipneumoniae subsp. similipneumoniae]|nr:hypothetical protein [Klebsiella quasipneumoniae subsp. similipneumoniae]
MKEYVIGAVLCFVIGFISCFAMNMYIESKEKSAVEKTIQSTQRSIAKGFEQQRNELNALSKKNKNESKTIINNNKEVYSTKCIDDNGLEQLKAYKEQSK